jgi:TIR domain
MPHMPLQKRPNDLFVSYGHADRDRVDPIVEWLKRHVGLVVWYDASSGDASKRTTVLLSNAIQASRGAIFFLSSGWVGSTWCNDEHEFALTERRNDDEFLVLAVRLDECELPPWFKIANVLDFRDFQSRACADLLRSLSPNPPSRLDANQDVYLAVPWSRQTEAAKNAVRSIAAMGWRLVGDSPDLPNFTDSEKRIASIIGTSRGVISVLPFDPSKPPSFTSQWILNEAHVALRCQQPYLLLAESKVEVPNDLVLGSFGKSVTPITGGNDTSSIQQVLSEFDEELSHKSFSDTRSYSFLATSLLGDPKETEDLKSVIEHASNMTCMQGQGFTGQHVQQAIIDRIRRAAFVLADVSDDHRNSLIESGIAMGSGTPLHLMCRVPENGSLKRRFMFEDMEMNWYRNPLERLATAYRIARLYRRRVYYPH